MSETRENRLKRLRMRCWRRGTKEMDLILGPFADSEMAKLSMEKLDAFEAMMAENDQDLYQWISGQAKAPEAHKDILADVRAFALEGPLKR